MPRPRFFPLAKTLPSSSPFPTQIFSFSVFGAPQPFPAATSPPRFFPFSGASQNPSFYISLTYPSFYLSLPYPDFFPFLFGARTQIFDIFQCLKTLPFWSPKILTFFIFLFDIFLPFWLPFPNFNFILFFTPSTLLFILFYIYYFFTS